MKKPQYLYVDSIQDYLEFKSKFSHPNFIFRGITNKDYRLIPSLYRFLQDKPEDSNEKNTLILRTFFKEDDIFAYLKNKKKNGILDLSDLYEVQHYSIASRFLDFTHDIDIALLFALVDFYEECFINNNLDSAIVVLNKNDFIDRKTNDTTLLAELIVNYNHDDCFEIKEGSRMAKYPLFPTFFDFDYSTINDNRIKKQKACTIFFPHAFEKNLEIKEEQVFAKIIIKKEAKKELHKYITGLMMIGDLK